MAPNDQNRTGKKSLTVNTNLSSAASSQLSPEVSETVSAIEDAISETQTDIAAARKQWIRDEQDKIAREIEEKLRELSPIEGRGRSGFKARKPPR